VLQAHQEHRLLEAGNIISSLMELHNCTKVLQDNLASPSGYARKMVPYRDSKLTILFKKFFEGSGRIKMILCVNLLIFSELVKDVLEPGAQDIKMPHFEAKTVESATSAASMGLWGTSFSP